MREHHIVVTPEGKLDLKRDGEKVIEKRAKEGWCRDSLAKETRGDIAPWSWKDHEPFFDSHAEWAKDSRKMKAMAAMGAGRADNEAAERWVASAAACGSS